MAGVGGGGRGGERGPTGAAESAPPTACLGGTAPAPLCSLAALIAPCCLAGPPPRPRLPLADIAESNVVEVHALIFAEQFTEQVREKLPDAPAPATRPDLPLMRAPCQDLLAPHGCDTPPHPACPCILVSAVLPTCHLQSTYHLDARAPMYPFPKLEPLPPLPPLPCLPGLPACLQWPGLVALPSRVLAQPRIAAYLQSDQRLPLHSRMLAAPKKE